MSSEDHSSITLKKINNEEIKPMRIHGSTDNRPIKGEKLFPEVYSNIYICARKKSGKTVVIQKILKDCSTKSTTILAFCSTVNKDKNWIAIKKWAKEHGIAFEGFPSIMEGKVDFLNRFLHRLEQEAEEELVDNEEEEEEPKNSKYHVGGKNKFLSLFGNDDGGGDESEVSYSEDDQSGGEDDMFEIKHDLSMQGKKLFDNRNRTSLKPSEKYQVPEYILVFDDLSHELKLPSLVSLLKKNRHYKLKVILSSQYLNDLKPESIKQMDYVILFKGQTEEKLEKIRKDCDLALDASTLEKIYDNAVSEPFGFLYIDVRNDQYRSKFDKMYCIPEQ
jgi:hypothetical protein